MWLKIFVHSIEKRRIERSSHFTKFRLRILTIGTNQCKIKNNQSIGEGENCECAIKSAGLESTDVIDQEQS